MVSLKDSISIIFSHSVQFFSGDINAVVSEALISEALVIELF